MQTVTEEQLELYQSIFRGRVDIYAKHWERNARSGYAPAYDFAWEEFNRFRSTGGSFKDFKNKKPIPLSSDVLKKHLLGHHAIGIYPILPDNTSYFIGDIIAEMEQSPGTRDDILFSEPARARVVTRETNLEVPFKFTTDNFQLLAKIICFDTHRNQTIVKDIVEQTGIGRKVLLLSERRDHLEILRLYLKGACETILISGEDSAAKRDIKFKQIQAGHYQVILSKIPFLERQFKQRQRYYKKLNSYEVRRGGEFFN